MTTSTSTAGWSDLGRVLGPEFAVRLAAQQQRRVPDVLFVARDRQHLVKPTWFEGPPDLVVEIISPDSKERDRGDKHLAYEAAGVREYWIIDIEVQQVEAFTLNPNRVFEPLPLPDATLHSQALTGLKLPIAWFWSATRPKLIEAQRLLGLI